MAALAESRKTAKYSYLDFTFYNFVPVAIETMGAFGAKSLNFIIRKPEKRITLHSGDPLVFSHLIQCLLVAIQQVMQL